MNKKALLKHIATKDLFNFGNEVRSALREKTELAVMEHSALRRESLYLGCVGNLKCDITLEESANSTALVVEFPNVKLNEQPEYFHVWNEIVCHVDRLVEQHGNIDLRVSLRELPQFVGQLFRRKNLSLKESHNGSQKTLIITSTDKRLTENFSANTFYRKSYGNAELYVRADSQTSGTVAVSFDNQTVSSIGKRTIANRYVGLQRVDESSIPSAIRKSLCTF